METYLLAFLEHLKCGYYFDVTSVSQFLGKKKGHKVSILVSSLVSKILKFLRNTCPEVSLI